MTKDEEINKQKNIKHKPQNIKVPKSSTENDPTKKKQSSIKVFKLSFMKVGT